MRLLGQRIVKANELTGSYQNIDVEFYAAGTDVYEYRCAVFPYNEKELANTKVREIRFDCVKVYAHPSIWEIF
ncbi:MAG: hypothetical protein AMJ53_14460 [Gammaproteobacteria bacterium SG8_11]|nr:MAG: hypothetical protein AMJ53_14460 [Gammaproteobacteria bacterium SG8_11]